LKTSYSTTPTSSVDAVHVIVALVPVTEVAARFEGAVGGVVSTARAVPGSASTTASANTAVAMEMSRERTCERELVKTDGVCIFSPGKWTDWSVALSTRAEPIMNDSDIYYTDNGDKIS
jgi:hypothetical protein